MKIKYSITRSTDIESHILIKNILNELSKPEYVIINQTENSVEFKYRVWRFVNRNEAFRTVDGGRFEVTLENKSKISFSFYVSPIFEILLSLIAVIFGITKDAHIFYFLFLITIIFIIRIISVKVAGNHMIDNNKFRIIVTGVIYD